MKKKAELLKSIEEKRKNVLDLLQAGNTEEAKKASDELETLIKEHDAMPEKPLAERMEKMDKNLVKKAVNSYLHKGYQGLSDEERQVVRPVDATDTPGQVETVANRGGVLVPVETADFVATMDTGVYRLRTRVSEYFARTLSGKIPLLANPTAGLVAQFDELPAGGISKGQVTFGSVNWQVKDYGLIVPVSNDLLKDAEADVMGILADQFFRAQVITENQMILAALDSAGEATAATSWKDVVKALNSTSPIMGEKILITNTSGWNELDTATDDNGLPILVPFLNDGTRMRIKGYEVIELPDEVLPNDSTTGDIPMYAVSPKDACYFIERQGLELFYNPYSDSAMAKNAVDVRITCRLDCKLKFATAVKKLAYATA